MTVVPPASGEFVDVEGGRLAYEDRGKGRALIFIHSVIADSRMWDREMEKFAPKHRTTRYDQRGFGASPPATSKFSPVRDLDGLISGLKVDRPVLVGSSMGGAFAIDYAVEHPERLGGLFLLAPGVSGFQPSFAPDGAEAFDIDERRSKEVAAAWSAGDLPQAIELLQQLWCPELTGATLELFRRMVRENAAEVFGERSLQHYEPIEPRAAQRMDRIRVPATVLVGDRDNPSSPYFARWIAQNIRGGNFVEVAGADHLINLSQPGRFDRELSAFLSALG